MITTAKGANKMYLNILKKDLKRKKAMNAIVLVFVILATMFVASGVNNILTVTTSLDRFMDMANTPDYIGITQNKSLHVNANIKVSHLAVKRS